MTVIFIKIGCIIMIEEGCSLLPFPENRFCQVRIPMCSDEADNSIILKETGIFYQKSIFVIIHPKSIVAITYVCIKNGKSIYHDYYTDTVGVIVA